MRGPFAPGVLLLVLGACVHPDDDSGGGKHSGATDSEDTGDTGDTADTSTRPPKPMDLYILAGETNMDGAGLSTALPPSLQVPQDDVLLTLDGTWGALAPASTRSDGAGNTSFGPEVTFGRTLGDIDRTVTIGIVKVTAEGASLTGGWAPGAYLGDPRSGEAYTRLVDTVRIATAALDAEGREWRIAGVAWMQGESDAQDAASASDYGANLGVLVGRLREDLATPDLPVSVGAIHCPTCTWRDIVRVGEATAATADPTLALFDTVDLPVFGDSLHYDGSGVRTLGQRFAAALLGSRSPSTSRPAFTLGGAYQSDNGSDRVVGYAFTVDRSIAITDLGTMDEGFDGLEESAEVGLWSVSGELLADATVPGAGDAESSLWGGWRFVAIETVNVDAGTYIVGSTVHAGSADGALGDVLVDARTGFAWAEGRSAAGAELAYPADVDGGASSWFGPNLLYLNR